MSSSNNSSQDREVFLPDSKSGKYFHLNSTKTCVYDNTWDLPSGAQLENCSPAILPVCGNENKTYSGKICTLKAS